MTAGRPWMKFAWATWVLNSVDFGPRHRTEEHSSPGQSGSFVDVVLAEAAVRGDQPP
jgi:hypothetical protein